MGVKLLARNKVTRVRNHKLTKVRDTCIDYKSTEDAKSLATGEPTGLVRNIAKVDWIEIQCNPQSDSIINFDSHASVLGKLLIW